MQSLKTYGVSISIGHLLVGLGLLAAVSSEIGLVLAAVGAFSAAFQVTEKD